MKRCFPPDSFFVGVKPVFQEKFHYGPASPSRSRLTQRELGLSRPVLYRVPAKGSQQTVYSECLFESCSSFNKLNQNTTVSRGHVSGAEAQFRNIVYEYQPRACICKQLNCVQGSSSTTTLGEFTDTSNTSIPLPNRVSYQCSPGMPPSAAGKKSSTTSNRDRQGEKSPTCPTKASPHPCDHAR